ncbi:MAG: hypothetical protein JOY82_13670 [Streptosporangiaceae bacterium]|nr:hypothetical protein [Streptosporangiaceae bacterium]MBV9855542.1 hypothetical protein [Streptosporangiaceae bacterium]
MADKPARRLADAVAAPTALSDIDGRPGRLFYRGYDVDGLAGNATSGDVACLLRRGVPPDRDRLAAAAAGVGPGRPACEYRGERGLSCVRLAAR